MKQQEKCSPLKGNATSKDLNTHVEEEISNNELQKTILKLVQSLCKTIWRLLKNLNIGLHIIQQSHSEGTTQRNVTQVTPEAPAQPCLL
jgi:hypothetical protein